MAANNKEVLEDCRIVFRNFAGREEQYNREGDRNFSVVLDDEQAAAMKARGWNVKSKPPREEGDREFHHLKVKVNYRGKKPPTVILITSKNRTTLDEETVGMLDLAELALVDMIIRPYEYDVNGKTGRTAYLDSIYVTLAEDELMQKYAEEEPKEEPTEEGVVREED